MNSLTVLFASIGMLAITVPEAWCQTDPGDVITYQGKLSQNGQPVDEPCDFEFRLYDALTMGSVLGDAVLLSDVPVVDGIFTAQLDFPGENLQEPNRWLEIMVRLSSQGGAFSTLNPRQPLTASPFALHTRGIQVDAANKVTVDGAIESTDGGFLFPDGSSLTSATSIVQTVTAGYGLTGGGSGRAPTLSLDLSTEPIIAVGQNLTVGESLTIGQTVTANSTIMSTLGGFILPDGTVLANESDVVREVMTPPDSGLVGGDVGPNPSLSVSFAGNGFGFGTASSLARSDHSHSTLQNSLVTSNALVIDANNNVTIGGNLTLRDESVASGDNLVLLRDSNDDGVIELFANNLETAQIHGNGSSYFNGGNVGIGTSSPPDALSVNGKGGFADDVLIRSGDVNTGNLVVRMLPISATEGGIDVFSDSGQTIRFRGDGPSYLNSGNVGIGTTSPNAKLDLVSINKAEPGIRVAQKDNHLLLYDTDRGSGAGLSVNGPISTHGVFAIQKRTTAGQFQGNRLVVNLQTGYLGVGDVLDPMFRIQTQEGATCDGTTWSPASDRNLKENFDSVNPDDILDRLESLPLSTWNYKVDSESIRHIGPMAQDFFAVFDVGRNETTMSDVDANGVAFAAIQSVSARHKELKTIVADLSTEIDRLDDENSALSARNRALEERLARLEQLVFWREGQR